MKNKKNGKSEQYSTFKCVLNWVSMQRPFMPILSVYYWTERLRIRQLRGEPLVSRRGEKSLKTTKALVDQ